MHRLKQMTVVGILAAVALGTFAHEGEDHSQDQSRNRAAPAMAKSGAAIESTAAQRLADGSLFVPKAVQRQLALRTTRGSVEALAQTVEFSGRIVAEPNAGGRVQASQAGRIESGPNGLPVLGQRVVKDQVLAYLHSIPSSIERGNQQAQLAELAGQREIAQKRVARNEQLEGLVSQKDMEAARLELQSLAQREQAIGAALNQPEALRAPVTGVVGAAYVVAGQLVDVRELLFEVVDPKRLAVEALAYDPALPDAIQSATAIVPGGQLKLAYLGGGRVLREQALPLLFRVRETTVALAVGQPVKVVAQTARSVQGVALPSAAVVKNSNGENVVWVHTAAERFTPRAVRFHALDVGRVAVTAGLAAGERVVVEGASMLAQVR